MAGKLQCQQQYQEPANHQGAVTQGQIELSQVERLQASNQKVLLGNFDSPQKRPTQHGRERQGQQQGTAKCKGIRICHRTKDLPLRSCHGEQRQQGTNHDQRRIHQRSMHFAGRFENILFNRLMIALSRAETAVDALDHDYR